MSHFVQIRTQIREREQLVAALRDLHHQFREGENLQIRGYSGSRETAEVVVDTGSQYDIGFRRPGQQQEYECVADWWGVEGNSSIRQQSFLQQINQQYAYRVVLEEAREQDMIVEEDQVLENGDRVVLLSERG